MFGILAAKYYQFQFKIMSVKLNHIDKSFRVISKVIACVFGVGYVLAFILTSYQLVDTAQQFSEHICGRPVAVRAKGPGAYEKNELCDALAEIPFPQHIFHYDFMKIGDRLTPNQIYIYLVKTYHIFIILLIILIPQTVGAWNLFKATRLQNFPIKAIQLARRHQTVQQIILIFEIMSVIITISTQTPLDQHVDAINFCLSWPVKDMMFRTLCFYLVEKFIEHVKKQSPFELAAGAIDEEKGCESKNAGGA